MKLLGSAIHYLWKMVFDEKLLCFSIFHFPGPDNLKNGDNSKSPKNELLGFAMQQVQWQGQFLWTGIVPWQKRINN